MLCRSLVLALLSLTPATALAQWTGSTPRTMKIDALCYLDAQAQVGECPVPSTFPGPPLAPHYDLCELFHEQPVAFDAFAIPCVYSDVDGAADSFTCGSAVANAFAIGNCDMAMRFDNNEIYMSGYHLVEHVLSAVASSDDECSPGVYADAFDLVQINSSESDAAILQCPFGVRANTSGSVLIGIGPVMWPDVICLAGGVSLNVKILDAGGTEIYGHTVEVAAGQPADSYTIPVTFTPGNYWMIASYHVMTHTHATDGCDSSCDTMVSEFENISFQAHLAVGSPAFVAR